MVTKFTKRIGKNCYFVSNGRKNFANAKKKCIDEGGFLAEPQADFGFTLPLINEIERQFPDELKTSKKPEYFDGMTSDDYPFAMLLG